MRASARRQAALVVLLTGLGFSWQASADVLVDNLDGPTSGDDMSLVGTTASQCFTTGSVSGYSLESVETRVHTPSNILGDLHKGSHTGAIEANLTASTSGKVVTFTPSAAVALDASTTYCLHFTTTNSDQLVNWAERTSSNVESGLSGWSVADESHRWTSGPGWQSQPRKFYIVVNGSGPPEMRISGGDAVTEGGNATFTVTANPKPESAVSVDLTISESGDFVASGDEGAKTVSVPTTGSVNYTVSTVDDSTEESDGTVTATLNAGTGYSVSTSDNAASVTVNDDDGAPTISSMAITSTPSHDTDSDNTNDTYGRDDVIKVTVTFSADVTWTAAAGAALRTRMRIGSGVTTLSLETGGATSGTARSLVFARTVLRGDADTDGVQMQKYGTSNRVIGLVGTATLKDGSNRDVSLDFATLDTSAQANHKVNGSLAPPTTNNPPAFSGQPTSAAVNENSANGTTVATVTATDSDSGDTITYSLDTTADAVFDINASTGVITVQVEAGSALDHEGTDSYTATVTATDNHNATATHDITISVDDVDEPPTAPGAPTVTGASINSVTVTWTAPTNTGKPAINDYDVQYKTSSETSWTAHTFAGTGTTTTIASLSAGTTYNVQVMAKNAEGDSTWSDTGSGATHVTITIAADATAVDEGTAAAFTLTANPAAPADLTVNVSVADATGSDFVASGDEGAKRVTVSSGATSASYSVATVADSADEPNGPVTVTVNTGTGYTVGTTSSAQVTMRDDDEAANNPATGAPTISGFPQVGQTLTAATSGIADPDGLTGVSYSHQWIRVDGANESDISGATSSTYTLATADSGKTIKVKVTFSDDAGNNETLTSTATGTVVAAAPACTTGNAWCATLTVGEGTRTTPPAKSLGYCASVAHPCTAAYGSLSDTSIALYGNSYTVHSVRWGGTGSPQGRLHLTLDTAFPAAGLSLLTLRVDSNALALSDATQTRGNNVAFAGNYRWANAPAAIRSYAAGRQVRVELVEADPTITIAAGTSPVTEGTAADFTVTADGAPGSDLRVNLAVSESSGSDYVASGDQGNKTVTIDAGETNATYSVATQDDSTDEQNGTVTVTVSTGTGYSVGTASSAEVAVNDNDDPPATNNPPVFTSQPTSASVNENSAGGTSVETVVATDADDDAIDYSLDSTSGAVFDIHATSGAITVADGATLDHEATSSYTATVTASDGTASATHDIRINVGDVAEPPAAPGAPNVSGASATSVSVTWTAPTNTGKPDINDYDVQYQASGASDWTDHGVTGTGTSTTISGLLAGTTYNVQVKAKNDEGESGWSPSGSGATNTAAAPTISSVTISSTPGYDADNDGTADTYVSGDTINVDVTFSEAVTVTGGNANVRMRLDLGADDTNRGNSRRTMSLASQRNSNTTLRFGYTVVATDEDTDGIWVQTATAANTQVVFLAGSATIASTANGTAANLTKSGLDTSGDDDHKVDGSRSADTTAPGFQSATVDGTSLVVTFDETLQGGRTKPASSIFTVTATASGTARTINGATTAVTISGAAVTAMLMSAVAHGDAVTVAYTKPAANAIEDLSGNEAANFSGQDATNNTSAPANNAPVFTSQPTTASVPENSAGGTRVERVVATDADGDAIGYTLDSTSGAVFDIHATSGVITVADGADLNHEGTNRYTATVTAGDGSATTDHGITINVGDVAEPPTAPGAPTVTGASINSVTVEWAAPTNTGKPAIDDYDVQYKTTAETSWTAHTFAGTGTTTTIGSLSAGTTYDVQVMAKNDEGDSSWSDIGSGATHTTITISGGSAVNEGTAAVFTLTANPAAPADLTVNLRVADATGSDFVASGNEGTKTVSMGSGATSVDYSVATVDDSTDEQNGPVTVTVNSGTGYTVGTASSATVTVNDDDAPANNAPVFTNPPASASVNENSGAGTAVTTIAATDADGDSIAFSLDSTSDAVFDIHATSGAITVGSGATLDHEATPSYPATVRASDGNDTTSHSFTISVADVDEPPTAPGAPNVTGASTTSVSVSWTAPTNTGKPAISDYDVQYKTTAQTSWTAHTHTGTGTTATIASLSAGTAYNVQVKAKNAEGASGWSTAGSGATHTTITISGGSAVTEGTAAVFTLTANPAAPVDLTVNLRVADATGSDFVASGNEGAKTVTISSGATSASYSVATVGDSTDEEDGSVTVTLNTGTGYTVGTASSAGVTVNDDDEPSVPSACGAAGSLGSVFGSDAILESTWTVAETSVTFAFGTPNFQVTFEICDAAGTKTSTTHTFPNTTATLTIGDLTANTNYWIRWLNTAGDNSSDWHGFRTLAGNNAPTVANPIPDQRATVGTALRFQFAANAFNDADGDTLSYSATKSDDSALPSWLSFTDSTRTFSGTPAAADTGTVSVKVTASDGNGGSVSDTFDITVSAANNAPAFTGQPTSASVDENSAGGTAVTTVVATDADGDAIGYSLDSTSDAVFDIHATSGAITVGDGADLNHEGTDSYAATVTATDEHGAAATHSITLRVNDVDEPPAAPGTPNVAGASTTSVTVTWTAPSTTGIPAISGYDVQYKTTAQTNWTAHTHTGTGTTATIASLSAGTAYNVQVKAKNAEGASGWSTAGSGATHTTITISGGSAVTEGTAAVFTLTANPAAPVDLTVNLRVADATGSDFVASGNEGAKTVTISSGATSASYSVATVGDSTDEEDGSVTVTLNTGTGYTVGTASSAGVTVNDNDGPANNAPVFTGQPTSASVNENSPGGTRVATVVATDADDDAIGYTLDSTSDAVFDIHATSGAITVASGATLDHEATAHYSATVTASDGNATTNHDIRINVDDVAEPPTAPGAPNVSGASTTSVTVAWTAPTNTGKPAINDYDVQYKTSVQTSWTDHSFTGTATSTTISSLAAGTTYNVQVKAKNAEGESSWSDTGSGATNSTATRPATCTVDGDDDTSIPTSVITSTSRTDTSFTINFSTSNSAWGFRTVDVYYCGGSQTTASQLVDDTHGWTIGSTTVSSLTATTDYWYIVTGSAGNISTGWQHIRTLAANNAPTVANLIPDQTATVGTALGFQFAANTFNDADGDTLTYAATQSDDNALPSWLSFTDSTRTFGGTPAATDTGTVSVKVTADDGKGGSVSDTFDIVVSAANNAPTVANPIPNQTATVGTALSFQFAANAFNDADGDTLTYAATKSDDSALPTWLSFTAGTRTFGGTPGATDIGTVSVKVTASDGNGGSVSDTFDITVSAANNAPTVANPIPNQTARVGTALSFQFAANAFNDADGDTLTYAATKSDDSALPTWLSFTAGTRTFGGTPGATDIGTVSVKVTASDGNGGSVSDTFDIVVSAANNAPVFTGQPTSASVNENSPGGTRVATVVATDADDDAIGYTLDSTSDAVFDIHATSGAITVASGATLDHEATAHYSATVTASDGNATTNHDIRINVDDVAEPPTAPGAPNVSGASTTSVTVAWTAPTNTGKPAINDYDVQYKTSVQTSWTDHSFTGTATSTTISSLAAGTTYNVQVKAKNAEGESSWSSTGSGATNTVGTPTINTVAISSTPGYDANNDGTADTYVRRDTIAVDVTFSEAVTVAGGNANVRLRLDLGADDATLTNSRKTMSLASLQNSNTTLRFQYQVATADTDTDGVWVQTATATSDRIVFLVGGATITSTASGTAAQLTKSGLPTSGDDNHKVDGGRTADTTAPGFARATVNGTTLVVTFDETVQQGKTKPASSIFTVTATPSGGTARTLNGATTAVTISGAAVTATLDTAVAHGETVTVAYAKPAANAIEDLSGNEAANFSNGATTNNTAAPTNNAPVFTGQPTSATVDENSGGGTAVETITATDADNDAITYSLDSTSGAVFDIHATSGAITVGSGATLDHEATSSYPATVTATDEHGARATHGLTIAVDDVNEPPAAPGAPNVAGASTTSVTVTWTAPSTTGIPAISDYDVQYRASGVSGWTDHSFSGTGTSATIASLIAGTTYQVQVKAKNAEGESGWSPTGSGATSNPTITIAADASPVDEGTAAEFTVTADSAPGADLTVNLSVSESSGSDYVASGDEGNQTVTIDAGETEASYSVTTQDDSTDEPNGTVTVTVSTGTGYSVGTTSSAEVAVNDDDDPPPTNNPPTGSVTIDGTATQGETLTANTSTVADADGLGTFSYQWTRGTTAISGANSSTYTLVQADVGSTITVTVSWTDDGGTAESLTSDATAAVANVNDDPTGAVTIAGTATQGQTLTADTSAVADADGLGAFSYQWTRGTTAISGANSSTYTLVLADVGSTITVTVTYTDGQGSVESLTSAATGTVVGLNSVPVFTNQDTTASVDENSAGGTAVATITATDADGDAIAYSLNSAADAVFDIDASSGAITVGSGAVLNYEATTSYAATVTANDGTGTATHQITISVNDVDEPPPAPGAPGVAGASTTSLDVTWTAPSTTGIPAINDYDVRYQVAGASGWTAHAFTGTGTSTTITGLAVGTTYNVQVQAENDEGEGDWSASGSGATDSPTNTAPTFTSPPSSLAVAENSAGGTTVGTVAATDADGDTLSYSLDSTSDAVFDIHATSGAITVGSGADLDHEATPSYATVVTVSDGIATVTHSLTISVTDVAEPPDAPDAPSVTGASPRSVTVTWTAPSTTGAPPVTDYDVQYQASGASGWTDHAFTGTATRTTIDGLAPSTTYNVQVKARNDEGESDYSATGSGTTPANTPPAFGAGEATTASVPENSANGTAVATITATDADGDTLVYSLDSTADAVFDIDSSGAITVQVEAGSALDHEGTSSYAATVTADDGTDTATHELTITVADVDEPPDAPGTPTVTGTSSGSVTVTWAAPDATGIPAVTDYDVQYRASGDADWINAGYDGVATTTTIGSLRASTTYQVQVRARNDEGTSDWSATGSGATTANNAPVFTDQDSTATVAENSVDGTAVATITATDADGDTLAYSLDSTADAVFAIDSNGAITVQVEVGSALDHEGTPSYTATVTASDGTASATHDVTIRVTDVAEPPAAPEVPTVTGASTTSVTVTWTAPDTTGRPAVTDYDVQYRASGDTAWIDAGYDGTGTTTMIASLGVATTYEVQVRARNDEGTGDWSATGQGATLVPPNFPPVFTDQPTSLAVAENSAGGTSVGTVSATDADGDTLRYSLDSSSDAVFDIDSSGAITVEVGAVLDHEATPSYAATVTANDGTVDATHRVMIDVADVDEPPPAPTAPSVAGASSSSVSVAFAAPDVSGRPAITDYDVQYRASGETGWSDHSYDRPDVKPVTITGLNATTSYEVQVRAMNDEGTSGWSATGSGATTASEPTVSSVELASASAPGQNDTYKLDDVVRARVVLSTAVDVVGDPVLMLRLHSIAERAMRFDASAGRTNTTSLEFTYTVAAGDMSTGLGIDADALTAPSGTTIRRTGTTVDAILDHGAVSSTQQASGVVPSLLAAKVTETLLKLTYGETLDAASTPDPQDFVVSAPASAAHALAGHAGSWAGSNAAVSDEIQVTRVSVDGTAVTLTLASAVAEGQMVTVSYTPGTKPLRDRAGNPVGDLVDETVNSAVNAAPVFEDQPTELSVAENSAGGTAAGVVAATDADGDMLSYSLDTNSGAVFEIDPGGKITVRHDAALDYEGTGTEWSARVTATDGRDSATHRVSIQVTDVAEPPLPPAAPTVTAVSTTIVDVAWDAPDMAGRPAITGYDLRYRALGVTAWTDVPVGGTTTTATITALAPGTTYEIQVRARNDEGTGGWSAVADGATNTATNNAPVFANQPTAASVAENSAGGTAVASVAATDADGDMLGYSLDEISDAMFAIDADGAITVRSDAVLDHEATASYLATVTAHDGTVGTAHGLTITVTDIDEPPDAPAAPVVATASTSSVAATWTAPDTTGIPGITDYDLRYFQGAEDPADEADWIEAGEEGGHDHAGAATTATITGLAENSPYRVQVRTTNAEGTSGWSASGGGATKKNSPPVFADPPAMASVAENSAGGTAVATVAATDADGDALAYALDSDSDAVFDIGADGAITVQDGATLDHEATPSYAAVVTVNDGRAEATHSLTVDVTDVDEPPTPPEAPTVAGASSRSVTATWSAPDTTGVPDISDYDVRYFQGAEDPVDEADWVEPGEEGGHDHAGTATTATITGLAVDSPYRVQVRATNAEGTGAWSASGGGATNMNIPPVFTDPPARASVAENSAGGTAVATVAATDADGDVLAYSLDSDSDVLFDIDADGEVTVQDGAMLDHESTPSYAAEVTVSDGRAQATHSLTIEVTDVDEPPHAPAAPVVAAESTSSVTATWTAPDTFGRPDITDYDLRYYQGAEDPADEADWIEAGEPGGHDHVGTTTTATIAGLAEDSAYRVQVRATNAEGTGGWSASGLGATKRNSGPVFVDPPAMASVAENSAGGTAVATVAATDVDGDALGYSLDEASEAVFDIDADGAVTVRDGAALDHEATPSYATVVTVSDGRLDATHGLTINVTDVDEPPDAPAAPVVAAASASSVTARWTAPDTTGAPAITDYDVRYRILGEADWTDASFDGTATATTVTGLAASTTYEVQVRAANDEGKSPWSMSGEGATGAIPVADAGGDQTVDPGQRVTLDGSGSSDADGETLSFAWSQTAGESVPLENADTARATFTAPLQPGALTFRLEVADPGGATDEDTATVTVRDDAPSFGGAEVPALSLEVGRTIEPVVLPAASGGNGALTYSLASVPAGLAGLVFDPASRTLSGTPTTLGAHTFTYRVEDADDNRGRDDADEIVFEVTAAAPPVPQSILNPTLAAVGGAMLDSAVGALRSRFSADQAAPVKATVAGMRLTFPGRAGTTDDLLGGWTPDGGAPSVAWAPCVGATCARSVAGGAGPTATPFARDRARFAGNTSWGAPLYGSAFEWSPGVGQAAGGTSAPQGGWRWTVWGRGDVQSFNGGPQPGAGYDGELRSAYLGIDAHRDNLLAGIALSRSTSDSEYHFGGGEADYERGRLETTLTAAYPYGRWRLSERTEGWAMLGVGHGEASHARDHARESRETSDLILRMAAAGLRHAVTHASGLGLAARADAGTTRLATDDGDQVVDGLSADTWRVRLGLEASLRFGLGDGGRALAPFLETALRADGGDGAAGTGLEFAGGLRYRAPRAEVELRGRTLRVNDADFAQDHEESGLSLNMTVRPRDSGRGLSLSLGPYWGAPTRSTGVLWQDAMPRTFGPTPAQTQAGFNARLGYGMFAPRIGGLLTPFVETGRTDRGEQRLAAGARWHRTGTDSDHFVLDGGVAAEYTVYSALAPPDWRIVLDLMAQF